MISTKEYIDARRKYAIHLKADKPYKKYLDIIVEYNKELLSNYPWLLPVDKDGDEIPNYNYSWTALDDLPDGWYLKFGEDLCDDIYEALLKVNNDSTYRVLGVKEKYGQLQFYATGNDDIDMIVLPKYRELAQKTCMHCGKPAKYELVEWPGRFCEKCITQFGGMEYESI